MKANELRIGNWVTDKFYDSFKSVYTVDSIHKEGINVFASDDGRPYGMALPLLDFEYKIQDLFPIPLTEEWLEKFGFKKLLSDDENTWMRLSWQNTFFDSDKSCGFCQVWCSTKRNTIDTQEIKFVHQLQNIYFALTGKELQIKVPA